MELFTDILVEKGINQQVSGYLSVVIMVFIILITCVLANLIIKKVVISIITYFTKRNKLKWNEILLKRKVFHRLALFIPGIIVYFSAPVFQTVQDQIQKLALTYIYIIATIVICSLLDSVNDYYSTLPISNVRPIKGFVQVLKIITFIIFVIIIIANIIGKSPLIMLSGLGALAAVFSFVFKDLILGLVAGVQLTSNDMLRIGDWIEVPKYGADGDVIELSLTTVKVQNFDKTIVTLPAYALISDSFKNWRGMQEAGGRRIKRSIFIDTNSIQFCTKEMLDKLKKFDYLTNYITEKEGEIIQYNLDHHVDENSLFNGRQLTNVGLFRIYITNYLKKHPKIHQRMTQLIRQLPPGEHGLPLEIYVFTNDTNWETFEGVQSDIFDHLLAIVSAFDLRVFQNPTGYDMRQIKG
ncbi:MAG: mechanosensitive ion channel [Eubacteriales bacterium]|nr:mechanosensitive ion channel [Eubacteriales bacterium]MDD4583932.1 mechanosensitive ion channel [Eubacteriales bacterium]